MRPAPSLPVLLAGTLLVATGCPFISAEQSGEALDPDGDGAPWYEFYQEWGVRFGEPEDCLEVQAADLDLSDTFTVDVYLRADPAGGASLFPVLVIPGTFALYQDQGHTAAGPGQEASLDEASSSARGFVDGAYHHLAVTRGQSGYLTLFLDGHLRAHRQVTLPDREGTSLYLGCWPQRGATFSGVIGEARIVAAAIYDGDFEPAWMPYSDDANVLALWHLDEGQGTEVLDAGATIQGQLSGGAWEHFDLACLDPALDCGPNPIIWPDADLDGFGSDEDCDDADGSVHPGAGEACDGVDNDCDGLLDADDPEADASCGEGAER